MKRKKIEIPVLKITKIGKPYKRSLEKVRKFVKENFAELKKENLPKQVQGYYAQIEGGKKRFKQVEKAEMPKIKFTATGKIYKSSLNKARNFVKQNFDTISFETLPDELKLLYKQIESGKKRGQANKSRLRNPETGKFLTSGESKAVKDLVRSAAKEIGIEQNQLIENKDLYRSIVDKALNDKISITKDTDLAIDFLKRQNFKTIILVDQNGKEKKVPIEKAILILKENQKKIMQLFDGKKFSSWNRLEYNTSGKKIRINYLKVGKETPEELQEIIDDQTEAGNFGSYGS